MTSRVRSSSRWTYKTETNDRLNSTTAERTGGGAVDNRLDNPVPLGATFPAMTDCIPECHRIGHAELRDEVHRIVRVHLDGETVTIVALLEDVDAAVHKLDALVDAA
jgi:hypothetical protein